MQDCRSDAAEIVIEARFRVPYVQAERLTAWFEANAAGVVAADSDLDLFASVRAGSTEAAATAIEVAYPGHVAVREAIRRLR